MLLKTSYYQILLNTYAADHFKNVKTSIIQKPCRNLLCPTVNSVLVYLHFWFPDIRHDTSQVGILKMMHQWQVDAISFFHNSLLEYRKIALNLIGFRMMVRDYIIPLCFICLHWHNLVFFWKWSGAKRWKGTDQIQAVRAMSINTHKKDNFCIVVFLGGAGGGWMGTLSAVLRAFFCPNMQNRTTSSIILDKSVSHKSKVWNI